MDGSSVQRRSARLWRWLDDGVYSGRIFEYDRCNAKQQDNVKDDRNVLCSRDRGTHGRRKGEDRGDRSGRPRMGRRPRDRREGNKDSSKDV